MSGAKRKILFATAVQLNKNSGGTLVCREHVRSIGSVPNIELHVVAPESPTESETKDFVESCGATYHDMFVLLDGKVRKCDESFVSRTWPFFLERNALINAALDIKYRETVRRISPDVIILDYLFTALFLPSAFYCDVPVIVISLNREVEFYRELRRFGRLGKNGSDSAIAEWRLASFEKEVYRKSDAIVFLTQNDAERSITGRSRSTVIEPLLEMRSDKWAFSGSTNLFYVGSVAHYPNFLAVRWLCEVFAPVLETVDPSVRITIIGCTPEDAPESWRRQNVNLLGRSTVEEVARQFSSCGLFIAPIENNFGSKIKICECLSWATPLIATDGALSGLRRTKVIPRISLDDPEHAAVLAVELVRSQKKLENLSAAVRADYVEELRRRDLAWPALVDQVLARPVLKRRPRFFSFLRPRRFVGMEVGINDAHWCQADGLYPMEVNESQKLRWTKPEAEISVRVSERSWPKSMTVETFGITQGPDRNMRVLVNNVEVIRRKIKKAPFRKTVRVPSFQGNEDFTIRMESTGFRAASDTRDLGLALKKILLHR